MCLSYYSSLEWLCSDGFACYLSSYLPPSCFHFSVCSSVSSGPDKVLSKPCVPGAPSGAGCEGRKQRQVCISFFSLLRLPGVTDSGCLHCVTAEWIPRLAAFPEDVGSGCQPAVGRTERRTYAFCAEPSFFKSSLSLQPRVLFCSFPGLWVLCSVLFIKTCFEVGGEPLLAFLKVNLN